MIIFQKLTIKNFLSYGNTPVTFYLNKSPTTLIAGKNGHGKSVLADAITFALFGKSFRGVTNPNLINKTNKSDLEVSIEFSDGQTDYKIVRSLQPTVIKLYKNGVAVDEAAAVRDFQQYIETNVLKFNYNSFRQTCIIGSSNHIPFLELSTGERRKLVEELFGINVFSTMNTLLKSKVSSWKAEIEAMNFEIEKTKNSIEHLESFEQTLLNKANNSKNEYVEQIEKKKQELALIKDKAKDLQAKIEAKENGKQIIEVSLLDAYSLEVLERDIERLEQEVTFAQTKIKSISKDKSRLLQGEGKECPSCYQNISHEHVERCVDSMNAEHNEHKLAIDDHNETLQPWKARIKEHKDALFELNNYNESIKSFKVSLDVLKENAKRIKSEIADLEGRQSSVDVSDLDSTKQKLQEARTTLNVLESQKKTQLDKGQVYSVSLELLKDSGIKSLIIKQYLPILNARTNHYLQAMNFPVHFELDDSFKDSVKVRNQVLEYRNFSMGEKQRMSLALLFAWRDVAAIKGSVASNILFLDETLDASLDEAGTSDLLSIIEDISEKTNVFVVSHKQQLEDKFRSVLRIAKVNGFSRIL